MAEDSGIAGMLATARARGNREAGQWATQAAVAPAGEATGRANGRGWLRQEKVAACAGSQDSGGRAARTCDSERQRSRRGSGDTEGEGLKGSVTKNEKGGRASYNGAGQMKSRRAKISLS